MWMFENVIMTDPDFASDQAKTVIFPIRAFYYYVTALYKWKLENPLVVKP